MFEYNNFLKNGKIKKKQKNIYNNQNYLHPHINNSFNKHLNRSLHHERIMEPTSSWIRRSRSIRFNNMRLYYLTTNFLNTK